MLQKNDVVTVQIRDMTEEGEGIGHVEGYPLFIKDAVVGDELEAIVTKAGKSFGFGRVGRILTPSPDRVTPRCPVAGPCGGCQLQALSYGAQLRYKAGKVLRNLRRIGGFEAPPMEEILGMEEPWGYRNKAQIPFGRDREGQLVAGFYAGRSHRIVPLSGCALGEPRFQEILERIKAHLERFHIEPYDEESGRGLVRHALIRHAKKSDEWMVCLVISGRKLPHSEELVASLRELPGMTDISLSVNRERTNVIMGQELIPLYGPGYITESIGELSFRLSPLAFFQVNPVQTERLYATALEFAGLSGKETVWDLYCGTGTISCFLARKAGRVYGVEIIAPAIENARANAARNGLSNTEFFVGKSEEVFPALTASGKVPPADVVVLDPPRKGCDGALLQALLATRPARIVYVSCDSATLARDLKILAAGGYTLQRVRPVDMFPQTCHCECVVLLSKHS